MAELENVPSDLQSANTLSLSPSNNSDACSLSISPGMTQYWTPHCEDGIKPFVGMSFTSLEAATEFYKNYAAKVGFDVRSSSAIKSRDGTIVTKHIVCGREGFKNSTYGCMNLLRFSLVVILVWVTTAVPSPSTCVF